MAKTAVLVDGNYYLRRAKALWGDQPSPEERARELHEYALRHITQRREARTEDERRSLYRIFYYDCRPLQNINVWQPWDGKNRCFNAKDPEYLWKTAFFDCLSGMRKVAMRMGSVTVGGLHYAMREQAIKDLVAGKRGVSDLGRRDYRLVGMKQSGVDMRIGIDVASMADDRIVSQIVLVAGDSDFVPVIKFARRRGIDFLVDPMGNERVRGDLSEESDGIEDMTAC